uniref:TPR_REGION domain-containing protein n=1 Tax=Heligmosomoides polygyrus TaxID=6339 RepID=A0A183F4W1_HELPZ
LEQRMDTMKLNLRLSSISEDLQNAVKFYTISSEGFKKLGYDRRFATACYYIGDAFFLNGDCKNANVYLLKSLELGEQFDDYNIQYLTYSKLSSTCVLLSEYSNASKFSR